MRLFKKLLTLLVALSILTSQFSIQGFSLPPFELSDGPLKIVKFLVRPYLASSRSLPSCFLKKIQERMSKVGNSNPVDGTKSTIQIEEKFTLLSEYASWGVVNKEGLRVLEEIRRATSTKTEGDHKFLLYLDDVIQIIDKTVMDVEEIEVSETEFEEADTEGEYEKRIGAKTKKKKTDCSVKWEPITCHDTVLDSSAKIESGEKEKKTGSMASDKDRDSSDKLSSSDKEDGKESDSGTKKESDFDDTDTSYQDDPSLPQTLPSKGLGEGSFGTIFTPQLLEDPSLAQYLARKNMINKSQLSVFKKFITALGINDIATSKEYFEDMSKSIEEVKKSTTVMKANTQAVHLIAWCNKHDKWDWVKHEALPFMCHLAEVASPIAAYCVSHYPDLHVPGFKEFLDTEGGKNYASTVGFLLKDGMKDFSYCFPRMISEENTKDAIKYAEIYEELGSWKVGCYLHNLSIHYLKAHLREEARDKKSIKQLEGFPPSGWKVHLALQPCAFVTVIARDGFLGYLDKMVPGVGYKFYGDVVGYFSVHYGSLASRPTDHNYSQRSKCVTFYPENDDQAVELVKHGEHFLKEKKYPKSWFCKTYGDFVVNDGFFTTRFCNFGSKYHYSRKHYCIVPQVLEEHCKDIVKMPVEKYKIPFKKLVCSTRAFGDGNYVTELQEFANSIPIGIVGAVYEDPAMREED